MKGLAGDWLEGQYDPMNGQTRLDMRNRITKVTRVKNMKDLPNNIAMLEKEYLQYKVKTSKKLDEEKRQNVILRLMREKWETNMKFEIHTSEKEMTYSALKTELTNVRVANIRAYGTPHGCRCT